MNTKSTQSGQIGVIVLLVMVVTLTIGVSLAAQTSQEVFLSQQTAESARVFNAAEAGLEKALSSDINYTNTQDEEGTLSSIEGVDVNYTVAKVQRLETKLFEGVTVMLDVTGAANGNQLRVRWAKIAACGQNPASLLFAIYSEDGSGDLRVRYTGVGACDHADGFTLGNTIPASNGYRKEAFISLAAGDKFIRVKPLYNDTDVRITGEGWTLPIQYVKVRSEAGNQNGNETRIVEVNRTLPTAPSVFDYALYSGNTLLK
jgi:hypothetical protein